MVLSNMLQAMIQMILSHDTGTVASDENDSNIEYISSDMTG